MGSNGSGQLGVGHCEDVHHPLAEAKLQIGEAQVVQIAAGGNHTLILLSDGHLWVSGDNHDGRCFLTQAVSTSLAVNAFHDVKLDDFPTSRVKLCAATWEASFAVLDDGRVIVAGTGRRGELGLGKDVTSTLHAQVVANFPPEGMQIKSLSASMGHVVVVLSNGEVYGWGSGRKGQLGNPPVDCWFPRKITNVNFRATKATCGRDFTFIAGPPQDGDLIVLGSDKWQVITNTPKSITSWRDIGSSWGSVFVLLCSGEMLSWGRNDHKQLHSQGLPKIRSMAIGSEHAICISESGKIIAWGWGEHGNCGPIPEHENYDFTATVVPIESAPVSVGAGCATSWIVVESG
jgi:protein ATS1